MVLTCCALLQNVYQFWVILVFGAHMLGTLLLLRFVPAKASKRAWAKLKFTCTLELCGCVSLRIPSFTDISLLAACLLWPPACFVSDATDLQGLLPLPWCTFLCTLPMKKSTIHGMMCLRGQ